MKRVLVLGAGTGGTIVANMLTRELDLREWEVAVVDSAEEHHYQPGNLFIPFRLYGYEGREDVARPIRKPLSSKVRFVKGAVRAIDTEARRVECDGERLDYDFLVTALGCRLAPEEVEGLGPALGEGAIHTFYDLDHALAMQEPLARMESGRLVVDIADTPIKCPPAPIEFAFLADSFFRKKGVRDRIQITLVTPYAGAFTKPNTNRVLSQVAQEKGIEVVPNFLLASVDPEGRTIRSYGGEEVPFDLLCIVPPNLGPDVIEESGLGDGAGYCLTDPRTLRHRKAERVYVIGDVANIPTSKAGSVAHFEAETIVDNLKREMEDKPPRPTFDGHAICYIESGGGKAFLIDFDYDVEPLEGHFPLPGVGPFSLLRESRVNHLGKLAFDWVYWNLLLPGHLAQIPALPAQMTFLGKDLRSHPRVRTLGRLAVRDVMTTEVVTVTEGSSLDEAAKLMVRHGISSVPVVDVEGRLRGIVTEADFLAAFDIEGAGAVRELYRTVVRKRRPPKSAGTTVDSLMTPDPVTISPGESLREAIRRMDRYAIKRLVVTDEADRVVGILSRADIMKVVAGHAG